MCDNLVLPFCTIYDCGWIGNILANHLAPKLSSEISSSNTIGPWKCLGNLASIELTIQRDCQPLGMPN